jgi:hypothetical protein
MTGVPTIPKLEDEVPSHCNVGLSIGFPKYLVKGPVGEVAVATPIPRFPGAFASVAS